jgi:hypothetical protein
VPLALTQAQLDQVMRTAQPIPPDLCHEYLALVAQALAGRDVGDGDVFRACAAAAKTLMWNDHSVSPNSIERRTSAQVIRFP